MVSRLIPLAGLVVCLLPGAAFAQAAAAGDRGQAVRDRAQTIAQQQQQRGTASISGTVMSADLGRPLRMARVTATAPELTGGGRLATTDENGRFELPQLPAGHYTLTASRTGFVSVNYGQKDVLRSGRPITVGDGQEITDIDFKLPRGSAITGRVTDSTGEPLVRARVRALRFRYVQGEGRIEQGGTAETDDRGAFRVYGLQPGTYFVSASANPADLGENVRRMGVDPTVDGTAARAQLTFAPTYYPGVSSFSDAAQVAVPVSQDVPGVDFSLQLVTAARITGSVIGPDGAVNQAMVLLVPDDPRSFLVDPERGTNGQSYGTNTTRTGTFTFTNVPPGRYLVLAQTAGRRGAAQSYGVMPLSVAGGAINGVTVTLGPGLTLAGDVTFEGAATPSVADMGRVRIAVTPAGSSPGLTGGQPPIAPRADGTFTLTNLGLPGTSRRVRVTGLQSPWALKAVYLDGRDITDGPFEIRNGERPTRLSVVLTDRATQVTGTVRNDQDKLLTDVTIVAFPADPARWLPQSRYIQAVKPGPDGAFTMRGLPPGEYLFRALDDVEQGEWYDPTLLETLRSRAQQVLLEEGDTKTVELKLLSLDR